MLSNFSHTDIAGIRAPPATDTSQIHERMLEEHSPGLIEPSGEHPAPGVEEICGDARGISVNVALGLQLPCLVFL